MSALERLQDLVQRPDESRPRRLRTLVRVVADDDDGMLVAFIKTWRAEPLLFPASAIEDAALQARTKSGPWPFRMFATMDFKALDAESIGLAGFEPAPSPASADPEALPESRS